MVPPRFLEQSMFSSLAENEVALNNGGKVMLLRLLDTAATPYLVMLAPIFANVAIEVGKELLFGKSSSVITARLNQLISTKDDSTNL